MIRNTLLALSLVIASVIPVSAASAPATIETLSGTLYGTIELPEGKTPFPVVLIHAGSGPTDRDGNNPLLQGKNDSLKLLAQALSAHGIASLRYDKRGIAASVKAGRKEEDLRFDIYVADCAAWINQLRADKRFSKIVVLGHSEGALIGTVAAGKAGADGFISVSGAGKPAGEIILEQFRKGAPPTILADVEKVVHTLEAGQKTDNVPQLFSAMFRPGVQDYLISWFKYDPAKEIATLKMPVLILQGTTDIQVTVDDAKLLAAANPAATLAIIDGMNHILKNVTDPAKQVPSYSDPTLPLMPGLVEKIAAFIQKVPSPKS